MSAPRLAMRPVDTADLPLYPISAKDRLDSHFFIQWNLKRWRKSEFRQLADPEVGWAGFQLICEAHDESPIGTLPVDERLLARAAGVSIEKWRQLCERAISPLHNWHKVRCDNGEIRLAHPVVQLVSLEALEGSARNRADKEQRRRAKQIKDLRDMIETRIGATQLLRAPEFLDRFNDWLDQHHPGMQRRETLVRKALEQFQMEVGL